MRKKWLLVIRGILLLALATILVLVLSCSSGNGTPARIVEVVADVQAHARARDDRIAAVDRRARVRTHRRGRNCARALCAPPGSTVQRPITFVLSAGTRHSDLPGPGESS